MNEDKIKKDLEEIETINIELDHRMSKLIAENEHLKQTYKQLYDSIKPARIRSKEQCDDLINQVNLKSVVISDLNASLQEKVLKQLLPALCYPTNDSKNLGKLQSKADIDFDELTVMASEHSSSRPALHEMTPATISSGLVPNPPTSTPFVPLLRTDWNLLFQPLFDELLAPPPSVDHPAPEVNTLIPEVVASEPAASTGSPSSTTVDQDAPSHISSSSDVIPTVVHISTPNSEHVNKWTKDHPLDNIISELEIPVSTRLQLHEQALFCYYDAFLTSVEPKNYKDALTQACWIEAMQEELLEFVCLEV
ncbi:hypothetical protein Tco_0838144 [Tanacetum coccineum]|uniref:Integrase, catalytic region, zinc finger, CCHC-type, peptidase aspartic, catalytic n=1 Tax=Tanacetum coccineum TaxID=301880 RepID=A0ABQ5APX1_9ASTR